MKRCLLLAFENIKDFNKELRKFDRIDAYGPLANIDAAKPKNLHIFKQFFWIENYHRYKEKYAACFIRHPDVWGEPINWIRAIAAIAESVKGDLVCEFWMPSEIIAFDSLLASIIGDDIELKNVCVQKKKSKDGNNFLAVWKIPGTNKAMLSFYRKNKIEILREFYQSAGRFYWHVPFKEVKRLLKKKYGDI